MVFLAFLAAIHGAAVLGPDRGGKPTYVHSGDWLGPAATPTLPPTSRATSPPFTP